MAEFEQAYAPLRGFEGGWCNDVGDAGGETYGGIARNFFPHWQGWPSLMPQKITRLGGKGKMLFRAIWRAYLALPIWSRNGSALSGGTAWGWPVFLSLWPTRSLSRL